MWFQTHQSNLILAESKSLILSVHLIENMDVKIWVDIINNCIVRSLPKYYFHSFSYEISCYKPKREQCIYSSEMRGKSYCSLV